MSRKIIPRKRPVERPPAKKPANASPRFAPWMFRLAVVCQLATVLISWPAWNVREEPVNLPLFGLPNVSFGAAMLASLAAAWFFPRVGTAAHTLVFAASCLFDQFRMQPQVASLIVLMWACAGIGASSPAGAWFGRWYLAAMWLWAGIHKAVSPEWFGHLSWKFVEDIRVNPEHTHVAFAALAAATEIALGLCAIFKPRWAAIGCPPFHLGVIVSLVLPMHNESVWPWNLATAVIGAWLLWNAPSLITTQPIHNDTTASKAARAAVVSLLMIGPAGYYAGWVNAHWAFILYSGHLPHALHTSNDSLRELQGWTGMTVPFPDSPRLFRETFRRTAKPGDKLHIHDPRFAEADSYYLFDGEVSAIDRERFHKSEGTKEVAGVELESRQATWKLGRLGVKIERDNLGLAKSVALSGEAIVGPALVELPGLPNLREVKIERAKLDEKTLEFVAKLPTLESIELENVSLAPRSLAALQAAPSLQWLRVEGAHLPPESFHDIGKLTPLQVLQLVDVEIDDGMSDEALAALDGLTKLKWLDLSHSPFDDTSLAVLENFIALEIVDLSNTPLEGMGLAALANLPSLEVVKLANTRCDDGDIAHLHNLARCRHIDLRGTKVTDEGHAALQANLPKARIER